ncbi:MAG: hypothetical protein NTY54_01775 [Actinobacteria bacterium]|nr:hypothetical protein [Actinomycetota bacterium]
MQNTVSPSPTADEAVAISTALELLWPKNQSVTTPAVQTSWRFSGRSWSNSVIARRSRPN